MVVAQSFRDVITDPILTSFLKDRSRHDIHQFKAYFYRNAGGFIDWLRTVFGRFGLCSCQQQLS